ncbi:phosphodiesterase [Rubripirellula amarantea]|uniref:Phosphodiesterase n=1 Tax=Rubripirellula amarantea TaxID=2527999 RepID=A0A5C5WJK8_9BACT|nr:metallophosphoesterase family protein [Rubripirellula amarantea]TWT50305.1 phosphodiesterase [Rubripirellula amarantea]
MTRTAILSDIHGNLSALEAVLADVESQNVDRIVCLGDVIGYGPQPCECLDQVMNFEFCILGNHDSSALFDPEGFNVAAEQAIFWTRAQVECGPEGPEVSLKRMNYLCRMPRIVEEAVPGSGDGELPSLMFVHGSPRGPTNEYVFPEDTQNVKKMEKLFSLFRHLCFQGHTHVPGVFTSDLRFVRPTDTGAGYDISDRNQRLMINVGSVGQPRDGDPRSCYVIHDPEKIVYRRVEYDIEQTVKLIEAEPELDNLLGYRLREGR